MGGFDLDPLADEKGKGARSHVDVLEQGEALGKVLDARALVK